MNPSLFSKPVDLAQYRVLDPFWHQEMELVRTEVIPYQWEALNDRVEGAAPSFCMHNFKVAGKLTEAHIKYGKSMPAKELSFPWGHFPAEGEEAGDDFYGFVFQDSDFAKWIEAVGYSLTNHPDTELEKTADGAIDIVCAAQQENGYLDTYYIINDMSKAFTNLRDHHELYCLGHLVEGAVAYYKATGKDKLLKAACRYSDYVATVFGPEEDKKHGYPGHEIAEMALVRLYETTGEKKYLDLAGYFIDERGKRPYYFELEDPGRAPGKDDGKERDFYHQAHRPVRDQDEAVGHAVRAVYLYSGMADIARLTGDESLFKACETLWDSITRRKMYITGGIGATHLGESFSFDYDLPADTAYAETCAAIGLVFFARRMLEIDPDSRYADVMERALYNGVLSGMALDGKSFFYVNPLEVLPEACHRDERKFHVKSVRQKWFGCACCPPNIARTVSSIASYAATENEDTLWFHLYMGGSVTKKFKNGEAEFTVESGLPWNGKVKITCTRGSGVKGTLALRIPEWCKGKAEFTGLSELKAEQAKEKGYVYLTKDWKEGDSFGLELDMPVRILRANSRVRETEGRVSVMRGPVVYCLEEKDNGKALYRLRLDPKSSPEVSDFTELDIPGMKKIVLDGERLAGDPEGELYMEYTAASEKEKAKLTFVPYYAWNNRGEGEMSVFVGV